MKGKGKGTILVDRATARLQPQKKQRPVSRARRGRVFSFVGWKMEDTRAPEIIEAVKLTKREMDLEKDLDNLDYNYKNARNLVMNELARIRLRQGELRRLY